jgi:diacylglycerol kinase (ATP)
VHSALRATSAAGDARRFATEAVAEGFDLIVAAGGDGTINEVLNGIGDAPEGFTRARLGVLPLGTANVFARELGMPRCFERSWEILQRGRELAIDLPRVEFLENGIRQTRYFCQLAGAGLDARAIELVDWHHKKQVGPLAYLIAGLRALRGKKPRITVHADGHSASGEWVLISNGRFYGGAFALLPEANWHDGQLDLGVLPRANWQTLLRHVPGLLLRGTLSAGALLRLRTNRFELTSDAPAGFELDGERVGNLPATFTLGPEKLRVIAP